MSLLAAIPDGATVTMDSAPIIYVLDGRSELADRFQAIFAAVEAGRNHIVISAITIAEVLAGPFRQRREALAGRYRRVLTESRGWSVMDVDADVAEAAARLRARHQLKLPDAIQLATALRSGSAALVTHDRDFRSVRDLPILTGRSVGSPALKRARPDSNGDLQVRRRIKRSKDRRTESRAATHAPDGQGIRLDARVHAAVEEVG